MKENIIFCPKCGESTVVTTDNDPLSHNWIDEETKQPIIDNEIYADAKCTSCKHEMKLVGEIKWKILY